ncbi:MAG: NAD(P)/FAD-dependent oxidoreductase [Crocinitomicaceae bacterium]
MERIQFQVTPEQAKDEQFLRRKIAKELGLSESDFTYKWSKRSIDARKKNIKINCVFEVYDKDELLPLKPEVIPLKDVVNAKPIGIVGSGPAGLFAALEAISRGLKPIVFERGKDVRSRRRDLARINKESIVDSDSNYCFGEGGAGTYSDGKLYTRSKKRGDVKQALETFVQFGADEDILVDAHPHIGTNKLPKIIVGMREHIIACGGEVRFESRVTDILTKDGAVAGVKLSNGEEVKLDSVILATGHSARDIFDMIHAKGWKLEAKPFALGVRIEHSQDLIDRIQYHGRLNDEYLPPASYSLVTQVEGRGVYSFCMCPGGIIAPCATDQNEVVTNGWSPSKRNNPYSNSGIVVELHPEDFEGFEKDPLVCLKFQQEVEKACWEAAGKSQKVPAQRMVDFVNGVVSEDLPKTSYQPGLVSVDLNVVLPSMISTRLRKAFVDFGQKMKGYLTNDAVLHATESRTSSPIKIPREEDLQHPDVKGLYPCGEGAGYAGGIISAAIDGIKCARKIAELSE